MHTLHEKNSHFATLPVCHRGGDGRDYIGGILVCIADFEGKAEAEVLLMNRAKNFGIFVG